MFDGGSKYGGAEEPEPAVALEGGDIEPVLEMRDSGM